MNIASISNGDWIKVHFDPPAQDSLGDLHTEAEGEMQRFGRLPYITCVRLPNKRLPEAFELWGDNVKDVQVVRTHQEIEGAYQARKKGVLVFSWTPETPDELLEQLEVLASMYHLEKDCGRSGRKSQLLAQFEAVCDIVHLARSKRYYLLMKAMVGGDFHPYETRDDRIIRIKAVRPLPSDFLLDASQRKDRQRRRDESIRIFGEAERETRDLLTQLRQAGFTVRRPHPNAQSVYVTLHKPKKGRSVEYEFKPGHNGHWSGAFAPAHNKTHQAAIDRFKREGGHMRLEIAFKGLCLGHA